METPDLFLHIDPQAAHNVLLSLAQKAVAGRHVLPMKDLRYMNAVGVSDLYLCAMMGTFITDSLTLCTFL